MRLIAQGNGQDVADQVVLCEYLASRGFVVAAPPSPMLHAPLEREDQVGALADTQASELAAAISAVSIVLRVDIQRGTLDVVLGTPARPDEQTPHEQDEVWEQRAPGKSHALTCPSHQPAHPFP